ncbi:hypothetical protein KSP40_PGU007827 [Platanthera guangdongensis]|uniref:Uncharacterized protein n=1 Tax=Platanthera guangdongensis TaxID=2320717 RepID=A0ABR2MW90_9ASPA
MVKEGESNTKPLFGSVFCLFAWGKRRRKAGKQMNLRWRLLRFHPPALRNAPKSSVWRSHLPPPIRTLPAGEQTCFQRAEHPLGLRRRASAPLKRSRIKAAFAYGITLFGLCTTRLKRR